MPKLRINSVLSHEMLSTLDDDQRRSFVKENAAFILTRRTSDKKGPLVDIDDMRIYDLDIDYLVFDAHYNTQGHLYASIECHRVNGEIATSEPAIRYEAT